MRYRSSIALFLALATGLATVQPFGAFAWNKAGQMTSGTIAYDNLKARRPDVIPKVVKILTDHPQFEERWISLVGRPGVSGDKADKRLFMLAARWPDDVRDDEEFDRREQQFIDHGQGRCRAPDGAVGVSARRRAGAACGPSAVTDLA